MIDELKGVPIRIGIGARDLQNGEVEMARRDTFEKKQVKVISLIEEIENTLEDIQSNLFNRALKYRDENITEVDNFDQFKEVLAKGGFISAFWDGTSETEEKIKELTKATIRCIPLNNKMEDGVCVYSGKPADQRVLFAIAY